MFLLRPVERDPLPLYLAAVVVGAIYGGFGGGLASTLITVVGASMIVGSSSHNVHAPSLPSDLAVDIYVLVALALNFLIAMWNASRRRFEEQLLFSGTITRNLGEGVYAVDRKGHVLFMNATAERLLGWSEAEVRGKDIHALLHPAFEEHCPLKGDHLDGATVRNDDDEFARNDGTRVPVAYTVAPIMHRGQVSGSVLTFRDITDRKQAVESLRASEERYRGLVETSPDSIWLADPYGFIVMANRRAADLFGYDAPEDLEQRNASEFVAQEDRLRAGHDRQRTLETGELLDVEYLCCHRDGRVFPAEVSTSVIADPDGKPGAIIYVAREISQRKEAEATLRASEARLAMQYLASTVLADAATPAEIIVKLLETVCTHTGWDLGVFWHVDQQSNLLVCGSQWHRPGENFGIIRRVNQIASMKAGVDLPGRVWQAGEPVWLEHLDAGQNYLRAGDAAATGLHSAFAFPVLIGGIVRGVMEFLALEQRSENLDLMQAMSTVGTLIGQFIERKQAEEALEYQAMHDALTDLPNRTLLHDRIQQTVSSSARHHRSFGLLLMDLDRFKEVNDTFGHHYGDLLLQEVARRLRDALRESDTVARLGGDEFALLLPNCNLAGAAATAEKLLAALAEPIVLEEMPFDVGASIGIAMYPEHGEDANVLMRLADVAMYIAKRAGGGFSIYEPNRDHNSPSKLVLKGELRHAIEHGDLILHFQPKVDVHTSCMTGVEALVRWNHPVHGPIQPDDFIALAEETGLIQMLSMNVLSLALTQCRLWMHQGINLQVAVNLSTMNLQDQQLTGMIADMLHTWGVPAERLLIEITESAVMQEPEKALSILERLHDMGIDVSIDDFGTGHSSLAYLRRLPVSEIKIDQSFVTEMGHNDDDAFIVRSVIDLGHKLALRVVAEGVETREILEMLSSLGCDLAQGALLGEPVPADVISEQFNGHRLRLLDAG